MTAEQIEFVTAKTRELLAADHTCREARDAADAGEPGAMVEERVYERAGEVPRRGMDDHSGALVDDYHVLVLEDDVERNVLWLGDGGDWRQDLDLDLVVGGDLHARLGGDGAVDGDVPGLHQPLDARTGEVRMALAEYLVEALHQSSRHLM